MNSRVLTDQADRVPPVWVRHPLRRWTEPTAEGCTGAACTKQPRGWGNDLPDMLAAALALTMFVSAATAQTYDITWFTIDSGGATEELVGTTHGVAGTIGQADTATIEGTRYAITGGFWVVAGAPQAEPPLPENSLGITDCTIDDDCPHEANCVDGTCYAPKQRYISIARNPEQVEHTARRISLQGSGAGPWWVGAPYEASGFTVANVVDAPVYADTDFTGDWPDLVNVTGCEIATNQTYLVQAIPMGAVITEEANYSAAIALHTPELWGDVVSTCTSYNCQPPDGDVDIDDILAAIGAFQSLNKNPLTWFDIAPARDDDYPNQEVDIDDILAVIEGFQSKAYPGDGPLDCP